MDLPSTLTESRVMELSASTRRRSGSNHRLMVIGVIVIFVTIAAAGSTVWDLRQDAIRNSTQQMQNLGVAFAEQTSRTLQAVDLILNEVEEAVHSVGVGSPDQFKRLLGTREIHQVLVDRLKNLPQVDAISLIDANGALVNYSREWPAPAMDLSDRDYIEAFRVDDELTRFFSGPVRSRSNGAWSVYMARRINGPNREFLGAMVGAIRADYLEEFYKAITFQQSGSAMILRRDGTIFARHPHTEKMMGQKMPSVMPRTIHLMVR